MPNDLVTEYLYRLKSPAKRDYAERYLAWLNRHPLRSGDEPEPDHDTLGHRAAYDVRRNLQHLNR